MTPAQKAAELFDKMNGFRITHAHRIKCGKVVCDEIMRVTDPSDGYWFEVKKELDKLRKK
jgi:hypothetical protein